VFGEGPTEVAGADAEFEAASAVSFTAEDLRFTRREGEAYAVVMAWPDDGRVEIETSLNHRLSGRGRAETLLAPEQVELLGAGEDGRGLELDWTLDEDALRVDLPDERPPGLDHACALRLVHPGE
jgi:alpha-L-fucosidase